MAKKSALDVKIAECDAALAGLHEEFTRWRELRAFLTGSDDPPPEQAAPKAKRTRGKGKSKPGLPAEGEAQSS